MIDILCFGDPNTFGASPKGGRHSWNTCQPRRLQIPLGSEYHMTEEGMGRHTTVWDDPSEPGRCGIRALPIVLQNHKPLGLIILLLSTNDYKVHFHVPSGVVIGGMENLCHTVQGFNYGEGYKGPRTSVILPIYIGNDVEHCPYVSFDEIAPDKSMALASLYQESPETEGCPSLDAASLAGPNDLDQLRTDTKNHGTLAEGTAEIVKGCFESQE